MPTNRAGTTLYELLLALAVTGVLCVLAAPRIQSTTDVLAVRAAREAAFATFTRARVLALQHAGSEIELDPQARQITVRAPSGSIEHELRLAEHDVDLIVGAAPGPVTLRYDAYGLGRMMSRTVTFQRGEARSGITISSFGRVRRW